MSIFAISLPSNLSRQLILTRSQPPTNEPPALHPINLTKKQRTIRLLTKTKLQPSNPKHLILNLQLQHPIKTMDHPLINAPTVQNNRLPKTPNLTPKLNPNLHNNIHILPHKIILIQYPAS